MSLPGGRIVCVGNRYLEEDVAGPRVYDRLAGVALPHGVEVIDGGVAGLNLLGLLEGVERVVFVDAMMGVGSARRDAVRVLEPADVIEGAEVTHSHSAGLGYLLRILPRVLGLATPRVWIVGVAGAADEADLDRAAATSVVLAGGGLPQGWAGIFGGS